MLNNYIKYTFKLIVLILSTQATIVFAQPGKNNSDFNNNKTQAIEYQAPDMNDMLFEDEIIDTIPGGFNSNVEFEQNFPFAEEDTTHWAEGEEVGEEEFPIVEVEEQYKMDSSWITIAQYYSVWDTRSVDPYKMDPTDFKDTIGMLLYDSLIGHNWSMPLNESQITSRFGMRGYRWHYGTDLELDTGDPIKACFDGIVRISQYNAGGYGYYVLVRHYNGLETLYGHMSRIDVKVGQIVKAGEQLGLGGSTGRSSGPHLHFEIRYVGNAFNPEYVYDFSKHTIISQKFNLSPEHYAYAKNAKTRSVYYHTVRSGETLGSISRKYRVSITTLCRMNRISSSTVLRVGRKLRIR